MPEVQAKTIVLRPRPQCRRRPRSYLPPARRSRDHDGPRSSSLGIEPGRRSFGA